MLNKRLVGVITVKNDIAVQSFGYKNYLPIGDPRVLAENLDRWGADEIHVNCIDRTLNDQGPDFELISDLGSAGLSTPIIYGGGIRDSSDGVKAISLGADRLCLESIIFDNFDESIKLSNVLGAQAIIISMPMSIEKDELVLYDYKNKINHPITKNHLSLLKNNVVSEVLLIDHINEGHLNKFNKKLIDKFPLKNISLILFGGIGGEPMLREVFEHPQTIAIGMGNSLNYKECAVQYYKDQLVGLPIRRDKIHFSGQD